MHFTVTPVMEPTRLIRSQFQRSDTSCPLQHSQTQLLETKWAENHLWRTPGEKVAVPLVLVAVLCSCLDWGTTVQKDDGLIPFSSRLHILYSELKVLILESVLTVKSYRLWTRTKDSTEPCLGVLAVLSLQHTTQHFWHSVVPLALPCCHTHPSYWNLECPQ